MNPSRLSLVHHFLENSARFWPAKTAFVQDEVRATYGQLNDMANRLTVWFLEQGVTTGDRVVLFLENSLEYVVSYYAVLKAGAVVVPLNSDAKAESLDSVLRGLRPRAVIANSKSEKVLLEVASESLPIPLVVIKRPGQAWGARSCRVFDWVEIVQQGEVVDPGVALDASALASIIFTSGSTGKPKGVMLSHRNIVSNTDSIVRYLDLSDADIQMVVLPFFYVMGKSLLNTHFAVGGTVVVNNNFAYPAAVIQQMAAEGVTGFSGVPSTYAYLLHRSPLTSYRDRLGCLRYCTQAGGHMSREIKEKLLQALPDHTKLYVMYGATEAAARLTYVEPEQLTRKIESIGRAIPGVSVRVLDEQGREVSAGELGELVAAGPNIMQGYWMDASATARVLDHNGYHTGDLGYQDQDGYLYVTGRKDDLLKVGGHRIDPQEIEDALMATGMLLEVAVVGVDDELLGKKLVAVAAALGAEVGQSTLLAWCRAKLPRQKLPTDVRFLPSLPKSANGKIDRAACLALVRNAP